MERRSDLAKITQQEEWQTGIGTWAAYLQLLPFEEPCKDSVRYPCSRKKCNWGKVSFGADYSIRFIIKPRGMGQGMESRVGYFWGPSNIPTLRRWWCLGLPGVLWG